MRAPLTAFFECGRCPDGGRFLHAFFPDDRSSTDGLSWGPYLVDVPKLVEDCGIPHRWEEWSGIHGGGLWIPTWVVPAIKEFVNAGFEIEGLEKYIKARV